MLLKFYVPQGLENSKEVKEIEELLNKVKTLLGIKVEIVVNINKNFENELKSRILWGIAISKKIKIEQTRRSKSLYPQLIVFIKGNPVTFYPQTKAKNKITIKEFLEGLLKGEIKCLHEKTEIENEIRGILTKIKTKKFKFDWKGGLRELREKFTSVELQHKALEWR